MRKDCSAWILERILFPVSRCSSINSPKMSSPYRAWQWYQTASTNWVLSERFPRELQGNAAGHSALPGNTISAWSRCLAEVQTTRIQTEPHHHTASSLGPSTAGLQTASVLRHSQLTLRPTALKDMQAGVSGDEAALELLPHEGLRAATGPCLLCFPIALLDPWSSPSGWQQPSEEAMTK